MRNGSWRPMAAGGGGWCRCGRVGASRGLFRLRNVFGYSLLPISAQNAHPEFFINQSSDELMHSSTIITQNSFLTLDRPRSVLTPVTHIALHFTRTSPNAHTPHLSAHFAPHFSSRNNPPLPNHAIRNECNVMD